MNAIEMRGIQKSFPKGGFMLELPELIIPEGYVTGFIGENGAGKTTTIKLLMNLLFPNKGKISILGMDAKTQGAQIRKHVGYVGETTGFLDQAKLKTIVKMYRPFYDTWDDRSFQSYVERFSLDLNQKHKELSKGKQKQFALAVALAHHPRLLLLDEPTANLDPLVRSELLDLLSEKLENEGITIFFSTHITSDLDKIADYLQFLHQGHLLLSGEKDAIIENHRIVKAKRELYCEEVKEVLLDCDVGDFGFRGVTNDMPAVFALLGNEAIYEKPTVEDIFLCYTKGERGHSK